MRLSASRLTAAVVGLTLMLPAVAIGEGASGPPYDGDGQRTLPGFLPLPIVGPAIKAEASSDAASGDVFAFAEISHSGASISPVGEQSLAEAWIKVNDELPPGVNTVEITAIVHVHHADGSARDSDLVFGAASYIAEILLESPLCCTGSYSPGIISDYDNGYEVSFDDRTFVFSAWLDNDDGLSGPVTFDLGVRALVFAGPMVHSGSVTIDATIESVDIVHHSEPQP